VKDRIREIIEEALSQDHVLSNSLLGGSSHFKDLLK
jgi:hypothetical protein